MKKNITIAKEQTPVPLVIGNGDGKKKDFQHPLKTVLLNLNLMVISGLFTQKNMKK
ncbi:MAG: hypothetical protein BWX67_01788 [Thermotogae bacterium ADurb.Bin062]|nr:MAG: hypothetical protein BWX67_01788 [Thermotogota bacterium ADurb.Bin062]